MSVLAIIAAIVLWAFTWSQSPNVDDEFFREIGRDVEKAKKEFRDAKRSGYSIVRYAN